MIKSISIRNFMALKSLDLDFTKPLTIIAGVNEAGKSSIRDSILWGFTGQARGLKTHADQAALIREGAKSGEVTISYEIKHPTFNHVAAFTRRKTAKTAATILGDIPDIGLNPAILFDPYVILTMPEAQRRELLFKVIPGLAPTEQNVFLRLCRWPAVEAIQMEDESTQLLETSPLGIIKSVAKMAASHGFPGAEKETVIKRREAKRVREIYKDAKEPEKSITIDGKEYDIPTLSLPAIEATLKDLQKEKDNLLRQKGAGEARAKRIEKIKGQLEQIAASPDAPQPNEIPTLQERLRVNKEALEANAQETIQAAVKNQIFPETCPVITLEQIPCPKAGQKVGAEPPAAGVLEALTQNRKGLIKQSDEINTALRTAHQRVESCRIAAEKRENLTEELTKLQAEPETGLDLDTEIATRQQRLDRGQAFRLAIANYNTLQAQYQENRANLAAAEQEVIIYDALAKALAPDGIPSQMIAEALDGINELLDEAATYLFPGRYLHLTGELEIVLQSSPYQTLSKSAKYRVGVAFQYALARLTGARILLIDEADILDQVHRVQLIEFLLAHLSDFDQELIFLTTDEPVLIPDPRAESCWLQEGVIKKAAAMDNFPESGHPSDHEDI